MANGTLATALITERSRQDIEIDIHGTEGQIRIASLRYDGFQHDPASARPGDLGPTLWRAGRSLRELPRGLANLPGGDYRGSYRAQWNHFVSCVQQNQPATPTFRDGLEATRVAQAAIDAARTGRRVVLRDRSFDGVP
jgi:predicted dehydrogenase